MKRNPEWEHTCTVGTVVKQRTSGDFDSIGANMNVTAIVSYEVGGVSYRLSERICEVHEPTGRGIGGRGFRSRLLMPVHKGDEVVVCYDPNNPKRAYLRDNVLTDEQAAFKRQVNQRTAKVLLVVFGAIAVILVACVAFLLSVS